MSSKIKFVRLAFVMEKDKKEQFLTSFNTVLAKANMTLISGDSKALFRLGSRFFEKLKKYSLMNVYGMATFHPLGIIVDYNPNQKRYAWFGWNSSRVNYMYHHNEEKGDYYDINDNILRFMVDEDVKDMFLKMIRGESCITTPNDDCSDLNPEVIRHFKFKTITSSCPCFIPVTGDEADPGAFSRLPTIINLIRHAKDVNDIKTKL